jgi:excisionase family DNA binding protein
MLTPPSDPQEIYRRAELRLRTLLFGDESTTPGVVRGGEETRLRVRAELRRMRQALGELAEAAAAQPEAADLAEELHRVAAARADDKTLLSPAEAARALDVSVSTVYRAVGSGDLRAVRLAGRRRGLRIPTDEVQRLLEESLTSP